MQRARSAFDLTKPRFNAYSDSVADDDSGIGLDHDYSSSSDLNVSAMTLMNSVPAPRSSRMSAYQRPAPVVQERRRMKSPAFIRFPSDGIVERVRPATMRNSTNGDYIVCRTTRGTYVAYRTPIVPAWVTELVNEIEAQQR